MNTELSELARRALACGRWRWMPGMLTLEFRESGPDSPVCCSPWRVVMEGRSGPYANPKNNNAPPDLTDPATLGCLLALAREAHGPSAVARHVGTNGRGGQEWAICDRARLVDGWWQAAPDLGYWDSEAEALVSALECAP